MRHPREDTIASLVAECLAMREHGIEEIPFERICGENPELLEEVRRGVEIAESMADYEPADLVGGDSRRNSLLDGRYKLGDQLGLGAMGVVYAAHDLDLDRPVAIKVINVGLTDSGSASLRFEREAAALAAISHEAVVRIYDRGLSEEGQPFLVMEQVDGVPCSVLLDAASTRDDDGTDWLAQEFGVRGITETSWVRQSIRWIEQVTLGVEAAHAAGVTHRDIKPSNILVRRDGRAVLVDFGIADLADRTTLTGSGETVGTPAYMAPEVLHGDVKEPSRQDVYGIAATLYHLLTRRAPYRGAAHEVLAALSVREPEPAVKVRPGLPRDVQAVLDHGLARAPQKRYAAADDMARDLRAILEFRPVSVRPTSTITRFGRRLGRSKVALGAIAASLLIASLATGRQWRLHVLDGRADEFAAVWPTVPANLGIVAAENRVVVDPERRALLRAALDRTVATQHLVAYSLALRALFRLDHGDPSGAADDLTAAAKRDGSRVLTVAAEQVRSGGDTDRESLPEAETDAGRYFAALLAIRAAKPDIEGARGLLAAMGDVIPRPAFDFGLVLDSTTMIVLDRQGRYDDMFLEAERLLERIRHREAVDGYVSATTAHIRGLALQRQDRHVAGIVASLESDALGPGYHVALQNAGTGAIRSGRYEDARIFLTQVLERVPGYIKAEQELAKALANLGRSEAARECVERVAFGDSALGRARRAILAAQVEVDLALFHLGVDADLSREAGERALAACELLPEGNRTRNRIAPTASALAAGDRAALFRQLAQHLTSDPLSLPYMRALTVLWSNQPESHACEALRPWIEALYQRLERASSLTLDGDGAAADPALLRR